MVVKHSEIKCSICGKVFYGEYYHGGSIEHDNYTCDSNMDVLVNRFNDDTYNKYDIFLNSITLDENLCNMKNNTYKVGMEIFECRLKWLKENNHSNIVDYLESNRENIKMEFNKKTLRLIDEKEEDIKKLKSMLII